MAADPVTKSTVSNLLRDDFEDEDDVFNDIDKALELRDGKTTLSPHTAKRKADSDRENDILGLDQEVKITKRRKQIAKLDEARLLGPLGIPKIRALVRSGQLSKKLHLKGRGHEFSDAAKLLNYFQLWLDNLYPRAKFAEGLQLVEKVGHSKKMQVSRKEWIDEEKPGFRRELEYQNTEREADAVRKDQMGAEGNGQSEKQETREKRTSLFGNGDQDDSNALFFPDTSSKLREVDDEQPEEDELDALCAGRQDPTASPLRRRSPTPQEEDDLDALLAEREFETENRNLAIERYNSGDAVLDDEEDDLDALLAENEARSAKTKASEAQPVPDENDYNDLNPSSAAREGPEAGKMVMKRSVDGNDKRDIGNETSDEAHADEHDARDAEEWLAREQKFLDRDQEEDDLDALLAEHEAAS